ncbi:MAG: alpha/beta hydrolase family protein [Planctomycetota bacterium]
MAETPRIQEGICYAPDVWRGLRIDMTEPFALDRPFLLWVHGGGWDKGDKDAFRSELEHFALRGWPCGSIDYRLSTQAIFPAPWEDVHLAARFVLQTWERVILVGASAGGHLAALAGLAATPRRDPLPPGAVAGIAALAGVHDLRYASMQRLGFPFRRCYEQMLGGSMDIPAIQARAEQASPIAQLDAYRQRPADCPLLLLIHGEQDRGVPLEISLAMRDRCRELSLPVECLTIPGCGHYVQHDARGQTLDAIEAFARRLCSTG